MEFLLLYVAIVTCSFFKPYAVGILQPIPLPTKLQTCYIEASYGMDATQIPPHQIQGDCFRHYLYEESAKFFTPPVLTKNSQNYFNSILRKINGEVLEMMKNMKKARHKRQVRTWRYRKEIRSLSKEEWDRFTSNLNRIKNDFTIERNISLYDMMAVLHSGGTMRFVHGGPNFPGWHQIFLLLLETILRFPIPFWDSSLDFELDDPEETILFSDEFFGNGDGFVTTGPFKDWRTISNTSLLRNIGSGGSSLLTRQAIDLILNATSMEQIVEPRRGLDRLTCLECHHNGPHLWVDGYLSGVNTAAWDPIFFCHHAMVDSIWFKWRDEMEANGRRVVYPITTQTGHRRNDTTSFLPYIQRIRNVDSLHSYYKRLVQYEPYIRYPNCFGTNIIANETKRVCTSQRKEVAQIMPTSRFRGAFSAFKVANAKTVTSVPKKPISIGKKFENSVFVDTRTKKKPIFTSTKNDLVSSLTGDILRLKAVIKARSRNRRSVSTARHKIESYKNSFIINGKVDIDHWSFISTEIDYVHPTRYQEQHLASYPKCNFDKDSKIYIESEGLNYVGRYKDFVAVSARRKPIQLGVYIGVKKPSSVDSEFMLTAYDSCGRTCRPLCYDIISSGYRPCSGAFRITSISPKMYSNAMYDKTTNILLIENEQSILPSGNIPAIRFMCDYKNVWPWIINN